MTFPTPQARTASRAVLVALAALSMTGCFQMTTVLKVNGDGSGTINHRMVYTKAALAQLKSFAAFGGGRARASADPLSEQQARDMTASIGPGVSYVSSELVTTPLGQGRERDLRVHRRQHAADLDPAGRARRHRRSRRRDSARSRRRPNRSPSR